MLIRRVKNLFMPLGNLMLDDFFDSSESRKGRTSSNPMRYLEASRPPEERRDPAHVEIDQ